MSLHEKIVFKLNDQLKEMPPWRRILAIIVYYGILVALVFTIAILAFGRLFGAKPVGVVTGAVMLVFGLYWVVFYEMSDGKIRRAKPSKNVRSWMCLVTAFLTAYFAAGNQCWTMSYAHRLPVSATRVMFPGDTRLASADTTAADYLCTLEPVNGGDGCKVISIENASVMMSADGSRWLHLADGTAYQLFSTDGKTFYVMSTDGANTLYVVHPNNWLVCRILLWLIVAAVTIVVIVIGVKVVECINCRMSNYVNQLTNDAKIPPVWTNPGIASIRRTLAPPAGQTFSLTNMDGNIGVTDISGSGLTDWQGNPMMSEFRIVIYPTNIVATDDRTGGAVSLETLSNSTDLVHWVKSGEPVYTHSWNSRSAGGGGNTVSVTYYAGQPYETNWYSLSVTSTGTNLLCTPTLVHSLSGNPFKADEPERFWRFPEGVRLH